MAGRGRTTASSGTLGWTMGAMAELVRTQPLLNLGNDMLGSLSSKTVQPTILGRLSCIFGVSHQFEWLHKLPRLLIWLRVALRRIGWSCNRAAVASAFDLAPKRPATGSLTRINGRQSGYAEKLKLANSIKPSRMNGAGISTPLTTQEQYGKLHNNCEEGQC